MSKKYNPGPARLVIASRESALAMWQAENIQDRLSALYPQNEASILGMTTQGDQILDVTLSKIGGKGLFVKELETALEDGRADLAVHSAQVLPAGIHPDLLLVACPERADPRVRAPCHPFRHRGTDPQPGAAPEPRSPVRAAAPHRCQNGAHHGRAGPHDLVEARELDLELDHLLRACGLVGTLEPEPEGRQVG